MNLRLVLACLLALAVGLPNAVISVAKALAVTSAIFILLWPAPRGPADAAVARLRTPLAVVVALGYLALSLFWTTVPSDEALSALGKHGKLIIVPLLAVLLRTRREALIALGWFAAAQILTVGSSWALALGLPVPWATSAEARWDHSVFTNYLAQSIMTAVAAAVCWHLRGYLPRAWMRALAAGVAVLGLGSTLFLMPGRTGYVVAIAMVSLAVLWQLPARLRPAGLLAPVLLGAGLLLASPQLRDRVDLVRQESLAFASRSENQTSTGERLNYWHRSLQAIAERPLTGFGLGSFNQQYNRLDAGRGNPATFVVRNPHQEFLLWGVEAGLGAVLVLCWLLLSLYRDLRLGEPAAARAGVSVLAALVISCMFNSTLFDATIGDFFCVVLGLLMALCLRTASPDPVGRPA
ncbi:O-antigen ligase family protein [Pseudorhodoferax sp.]|uniref:O-antigen ligase family protein n=1 Tax=Pseudorhodoferax sp. TaxID=1993553 RepID=UPI0039E2B14E